MTETANKHAPLENLLQKKEKEWKELQELRVQSFEEALKLKDTKLKDGRQKFEKLKEDFKYNLMLLQERDQELNKTEALLQKVKSALSEKVAEISFLNIKVDEMKMAVATEAKGREDLQLSYQKRLKSREQDLLRIKIAKDEEVKKERDSIDNYKRNLERQLREVEEELGIQKQELTSEMDEVLKKREREYRNKLDETSSTLLSYEMKVKLLSRELELVRQEKEKSSGYLKDVSDQTRAAEKKLKQKEWELEDLKAMKDTRIHELESELQLKEATVKQALEDYQRRHAELDRFAREKEAAMSAIKANQNEIEQSLKDQLRNQQAMVESLQVEKRRMEWSNSDLVQERDRTIDRLQILLSEAKSQSDLHLGKISKEVVTKDLEIQALKDVQDAIRGELTQRREDLERYKKELSMALEREASLERSKTQLDLDWQRRCEATERNQFSSSEDLVEKLSKAREEREAIIKEQLRELNEKNDLIRALTGQRDQAMSTLDKHGGLRKQQIEVFDREENSDEFSMENLRQQNEMLRNAIGSMRQDMESLGQHHQDGDVSTSKDGPITEDYVKMIEKECRELKIKNRELKGKLSSDNDTNNKVANKGVCSPSSNNVYIQRHVQSLNDTIGTLRTEKLGLSAQLKKQQIRITSLESRLSQITQQPATKHAEIEQLQYEVTTQMRRHATEVQSLKERIADLELELAETRREADEYYKAGLQTNLEATALGNQVSALKMDIASKHMHSHQALYVHELQREVDHLRTQLANKMQNREPTGDIMLREKLKSAAKHIHQLASERQQLIEMGNKLRAELNKYRPSKDPSPLNYGQPNVSIKQLKEDFQRKFEGVEQLQYQLTKKELQHATRGIHRDEKRAEVVQVELSSSSSASLPEDNEEVHPSMIVPEKLSDDRLQESTSVTTDQSKQTLKDQSKEAMKDQLEQKFTHNLAGDSTSSSRGGQTPLPMSTFGQESLTDVWQLLDTGMSFMQNSYPNAEFQHFTHNVPDDLGIQGEAKFLEQKPSKEKRLMSNRVVGKVPQKLKKQTKIRNYNIRDDKK